jgi:hypothetical protein
MLGSFLAQQLSAQQDIWFQQDKATAHTAKVNMDSLCTMLGNYILSSFAQIQWPNFFLWGQLKDTVYRKDY